MERLIYILDNILGRHDRRKNEYLYFCPFCHHHKKKLSVNFEKDRFKCWVCEYTGNAIFKLVRRYGTLSQLTEYRLYSNNNPIILSLFEQENNVTQRKTTTSIPVEYTFLSKNPVKSAIEFLLNEKDLTIEDIYQWKIGYCKTGRYAERVFIPSFNVYGNCNFFTARAINKKQKVNYLIPEDVSKNDIIFNEININWEQIIYLTEGVFDAIKIGGNVIPLMGKSLGDNSELLKRLSLYDPIIKICLDTDLTKQGYVNRSVKLAEKLMRYGLTDVSICDPFPYKDFGEIPKKEIPEFLLKSKKIDNNYDLLQKELEQLENTIS